MTITTEALVLLRPLVLSDTMIGETYARVVFSHLTEPGDRLAGQLTGIIGYGDMLELIQSPTALLEIEDRLAHVGMDTIGVDQIRQGLERWLPRLNFETIHANLKLAGERGIEIITEYDPQWPAGLFRLGSEGPHVLWVRGDASVMNGSKPTVAIVGARASTSYGENVTNELVGDLARSHTIISGAAYGIDGMAHRVTIAAGGRTVAYLAGGVDRPYPAGHADLIERITHWGAVVSEVPPGSSPTKWRFLQRNRLIAAHADATVVVEAGWRSGSLNAAAHAKSNGRPVGAVPGPITSAASAGCHRLIKEYGAKVITSADDIRQLTSEDE